MSSIPWLDHTLSFPEIDSAAEDPNGLLAAGGDLSGARLIAAYRSGIFPWYSDDQPILWWSPNPRCVLHPNKVHISRSLRKQIRQTSPTLTFNHAFEDVIRHCARLDSEEGTWITSEMENAYIDLHHLGHAHSLEIWEQGELTGGLYGLAIGRCFFGESMFSLKPNRSKIAFASLCKQLDKWNYSLIDCQVENPHLLSLGASTIDRQQFLSILINNIDVSPHAHQWRIDSDLWCT